MNAKRVFYLGLGGLALLIGLCVAGTFYANKHIQAEGKKLHEFKLESSVLDRQNQALEQAKRDIKQYEELERIAKSVVPQEKDQARTVLELVNLASESGIRIISVEFPRSELGQVARRGSKKAIDSNLTQLTPLTSPKGVYSMEITVQADPNQAISYNQLIDYLTRLENNRRTAQVNNISIIPSTENRNQISFTLSLSSFVKP